MILTRREAEILKARHGLDSRIKTLRELGKEFRISCQWTGTLQKRAERKLLHKIVGISALSLEYCGYSGEDIDNIIKQALCKHLLENQRWA